MNNDVYNNKKGSSLEEAYAKLREAQAQRNASVNQQQYDMTNGVALNTTPLAYNRVQSLSQENLTQTQEQSDDANWAVRLAGTITQGLRNVGKGFLKLGEGVVDAHLAVGGLFNKEWAENVVKFDVTNAIMEWEAENASINALYKKKTGRNLFDESYLNDAHEKVQNIAQGVEQGIGNALGFMALSAIPYAGVGLTIMGAGGTSLEENFNDPDYNGDFYGAWGSAAISGGIEAGLERVFGWSPKKSGVSLKTFKSVMKEVGKNFVEEGIEEVASDIINPFFEGMYTDKTLRESYDDVTFESLAETFIVGGLTGSIMTGAGEVSSTLYLSPEGKKIANKIQYNQELYNEAYENFKNNPNEQEAYDKFIKVRDEVSANFKSLGEQVSKLASKYQNRIGDVVRINGEKVSLRDNLKNTSEKLSNVNPIVQAVGDTVELAREAGIKEFENLEFEFVTPGTKRYKEVFGKEKPNGAIIGNKIYLSTNPQEAFKFIIGHELTHPFENMKKDSAYKKIYDEIIDSLQKDGTYDDLYKTAETNYAKQVKNKTEEAKRTYLNQEIIADYFGRNIKNFNELQKVFQTRSSWQKFIDKLKSLRKGKTSDKARELYQKLIEEAQKTDFKEKKQPSKAVAYSKSGKVFKLPEWYKEKLRKGTRLKDSEFVTLDIKKLIEDNSLMTGSTTSLRSDVWGEKESDYTFDENKIQDWWYAPIIVDNKDGKYKIQDGRHRVIALYNAGYSKIEVVMYEPRTRYSKSSKEVEIELENKNADSYIKAKKEFGTTYRLDYAGWLNVDGSMLDFSEGQGYRVQDHREIQNIYKDSQWTDALIQYLAEGNIRLQSYGFEVWRKPTPQQIEVLKRHIKNNYGEVVVDIDINKKGDTKTFEYEKGTPTSKIIDDINNYFDYGIEPVIDKSEDFRYSITSKGAMQQPKQKLVAHLKDGKVYDVIEGQAVLDLIDKELKQGNSKVIFTPNREELLEKINKLLNLEQVGTNEFNTQLETLAKEIVTSIQVSVETNKQVNNKTNKKVRKYVTLTEYLGLTKQEIEEYFVPLLTQEINKIAVEEGSKSLMKIYNENTLKRVTNLRNYYERFITDLTTAVTNLKSDIKTLKDMEKRARKATLKIATIKYWGKSTIDPKANYGENKLEGIFMDSAKAIGKLKFTNITSKLKSDSDFKELISNLTSFYNNEQVKQYRERDLDQANYIIEALTYFATRNSDEALKVDEVIDNPTYPIVTSENKSEIEVLADILTEMRKIINASRKTKYAELDGQKVIAKDVAKEEIIKQKQIDRNTKLVNNFFTKGASAYVTSLVDIKAYMTIMSHGDTNSLMMKLYNQLFEGQKETYKVHQDLMSGLREKLTSKEGKKLGKSLKKKKLTFKGVEMTYGEAISLYMMMKTDNAYTHLVGEGIKLETNKVGQERRILGSQFASFETEANLQEREMIESILNVDIKGGATYSQEQKDYLATLGGNPNKSNPALRERLTKLNQEAIEEARKALKKEIGSEYDELISTLEEMYTKSGKYYVSASEKMLGMSFTPKKYYYPTKSAKTELSEVDALASFVHTTLNPSFTKKTTGGSNALYVGDVIDTALGFAKTLSTYAGVTVEVKNVQKFLNAKYKDSNGVQITLNDYLNNNVDNRFSSRIDGLFKAMQGIEVGKQSDIGKALKWIRSMAAKSALGANIKTIITQFSSYPKAFMFLSGKSVLKGIFSIEKGRFNDGLVDFKWAREHSPYINNRYLENNVYNIESIGALSQVDKLTDFAMKPIEKADMLTLARIWYACQYEVMENGVVDHDKALKLFEQVTADTQAQYDALGNGSVTRTGNEVMNSFLMYSAENRKTLSRIVESIYLVAVSPKGSDARKKASRYLAKTTASVMTQALAVTLIASLLRGLKGDYDDKEKEEILKEILIDEFSMNFVGMLPIMKDIYNYLINGYDIQISGVSQMTEFLDVFSKYIPTLLNVESTDADRKTAWIQLLTKIGHFFGVPVRNLYNGLMYLGGTADLFFDTNIALQMKNLYYNTNNTGLNTYLKTYAKRGNMDGASKVIQIKFNKYISGDIDDASAKEMARLYSVGALTSFPTQLTTSMTFEGEEVTLTKAQISHAKEVYALANDILPQMLKSSTYRALSDEEKAFAIKKLFDTYHDLAKQEVFEGYEGSRLSRVADYVNVSKFASALAKINNIEQTKTQSRKMLVQRYINSLSMKASEKYLLLYLAGYSLNDEKQNVVKSYLRQNGMTYRDAKDYFA